MENVAIIIIIFNAQFITPKGALRTYLFSHGHPIVAFITPINNEEFHNEVDKEFLKVEKAHCYSLIIPVKDEETGNLMFNYIVRKKGSSIMWNTMGRDK